MGTREDLLDRLKCDAETVEFCGFNVNIRKLSARERLEVSDQFGDDVTGRKALEFLCWVVSQTVVSDSGSRLFSDEDRSMLAETDWSKLEPLAMAAMRVNGLSADVIDEAKKN